jgi:ankyrin repeat protein
MRAANANEKVLAELLAVGCDVDRADNVGRTPCFIAAKNTNEKPLALLLSAGCDTARAAAHGECACHVAAANANEKVIGALLAAGADCDVASASAGSACHVAAANVNEKVMQALIAGGANIRKTDRLGSQPVHIAAASPNERVAAALAAAGASFNVADNAGFTPLHVAAVNGGARVPALLLRTTDAVQCIDRGDAVGRTPMHLAVRHQNDKMIEMLICAGADVNVHDLDGWTAMANLTLGNVSILTLLVAGGADAASTRYANVAMDQAVWSRKPAMIAMLLAAGGSLDVTNWRGVSVRERIVADWPAFDFGELDVAGACRAVAARQLQLIRRRAADVVIGMQPLELDALQMCEVLLFACGPVANAVPFHTLWAIAVAAKHFRR